MFFKSPKVLVAAPLAVAIASTSALAVEPKKIELGGGLTITPLLDLEVGYDDNIRGVGIDDESSWVTTLSPSVLLEAIDGLNLYQLKYRADARRYHSSQDDDHVNHSVEALGTFVFNQRNRLNLAASHYRTESVANTRFTDINDEFSTSKVGAVYGFGVPSATFNFDLGADYTWRRTDNSGGINRDREYDITGVNGILYYRVSPKTRMLAEYRYQDYEYELSTSTLDNDRDIALVGITWDATAKTVGTIKVGYEDRDFSHASQRDFSNTFWEVDVTWQPRPLSTITFGTQKGSAEGETTANYAKTTTYDLGWNQRWTDRVHSDVFYSFKEEDYRGMDREDDITRAGVSINYDLLRWVTVGVGYTYYDRDSPIAIRDYDRNIYALNFNFSL
ncbi:MAG: outer membrane beta-barrel protein [Porticoccaceae bacterium]|nr:outer membrane beta-barrel protein [Porticoccaceae bacterium]